MIRHFNCFRPCMIVFVIGSLVSILDLVSSFFPMSPIINVNINARIDRIPQKTTKINLLDAFSSTETCNTHPFYLRATDNNDREIPKNDILFTSSSASNPISTLWKNNNVISLIVFPLLLNMASTCLPNTSAVATGSISFTNDYIDPLHPQCRRHIEVNPNGKTFRYSGTDVGSNNNQNDKTHPIMRGCSPQEIKQFGLRKGSFEGVLLEGNRISAGDGIHEGVWESAHSASTISDKDLAYSDVDGIRWNDGNKWIVKEKSIATRVGEIVTFSYIGFSLVAGVFGLQQMYKKKMTDDV